MTGPNSLKYNLPGRVDVGGDVTAKDIMIATGSVPFVPPGIPIDGKTVSILILCADSCYALLALNYCVSTTLALVDVCKGSFA